MTLFYPQLYRFVKYILQWLLGWPTLESSTSDQEPKTYTHSCVTHHHNGGTVVGQCDFLIRHNQKHHGAQVCHILPVTRRSQDFPSTNPFHIQHPCDVSSGACLFGVHSTHFHSYSVLSSTAVNAALHIHSNLTHATHDTTLHMHTANT